MTKQHEVQVDPISEASRRDPILWLATCDCGWIARYDDADEAHTAAADHERPSAYAHGGVIAPDLVAAVRNETGRKRVLTPEEWVDLGDTARWD